MVRLQFEITIVASPKDERSNTLAITSIKTEDEKTYCLSGDKIYMANHTELMKTDTFAKVRNSIKRRHQSRKVWITLTDKLKEIYSDEEGNLQFLDEYLEEVEAQNPAEEKNDNLNKILEKLVEASQKRNGEKNLKNIAEKYLIEKFTSKNSNAKQWMETFEKECTRLDITEDEQKIEVLRLFLDKSCADWHSATLTRLSTEAQWGEWKNRFLETFADKGWNTVTYALAFKYKEGSLIDYAIKKEKLLLDMNKDIDSVTLTALIATGLPEFILNRIDRESCTDSTTLFTEIRKYENLANRKTFMKRTDNKTDYKKRNEEKKPCKICEDLNKGSRYHPQEACWFKTQENNKERNKPKVVGQHSVIEVELNTETKNEQPHH
ncbi:uncharacterized protein LOC105688991 [Athalia rosae]|uniref:uncharacterized protein LOC105688991 n=1 Tax=Athalia rosae TaxID=37344 RepID=UPI002033DAB7|nr:uncharacterized protein LOC105688991 [Athalia rosae]XP_048513995.1 uncharacterized protein LOC105688991 [Athalia rosae]